MVIYVLLGVLLVASLAGNGVLWQHVKVVERVARENSDIHKRDLAVGIYGQLERQDWESLGTPKYELLDAVGPLNYHGLMCRWYGKRPAGHYIAQAMSERKGKDASPILG